MTGRQGSTLRSSKPSAGRRSRAALPSWIPPLAFVALLASGCLYLLLVAAPRERRQTVDAWEARLNAMADDRLAAIDSWLSERLADARVVAHQVAPLLEERAIPGLPAEEASKKPHLLAELAFVQSTRDYAAIRVFDHSGLEVAEQAAEPVDPACLASIRRALDTSIARFGFHEHRDGAPAVAVTYPLALDEPGTPAESAPWGAVLLEMDPRRWLYPFLGSEPAPTETGETLLVRQEGEQARFLSPLRKETVGVLRRPLDTPGFAARPALLGLRRFGEFEDYRGTPVLAATRHLEAAPWGLVVKVDTAEALSGYRRYQWRTGGFGAGLTVALLAIAVGFRRQQRAELELALAHQAARLGQAIDQARDVILFIDRQGRIREAHGAIAELYGHSRDELCRLSIDDLRAAPGAAVDLERAWQLGELRYDSLHRRRDGSTLGVEINLRQVLMAEEEQLLAIVRDVTERRRDEERIRLLNRVLRTLSEINQLVVREPDPEELLRAACRVAVEHGELRLAWAARIAEGSGGLRLVAAEGAARELLEERDDLARQPGLGAALGGGRMVTFAVDDEATGEWREALERHGIGAGAAAPIRVDETVVGALVLCVDRRTALDAELLSVIEEIAADLGFALGGIERQRHREKAEAQLRAGEARFRVALLHSPVFVFEQDQDLVYTWVHRPPPGKSEEETLGATDLELFPEDGPRLVELKRRVLDSGEPHQQELTVQMGAFRRTFDATFEPVRDPAGQITGLLGTAVDITERKATEEHLRKLNRAVEQSPAAVLITDPEGRIEYVNPAFTRLTGYTEEEALGRNPRFLSSGETPPAVFDDLWATITAGQEWSDELLNRDKAGRLRVNDVRISALRDERGTITHFVSVQQDVTWRKEAEKQIDATQRQLLQAQKMEAIGRLAGGVAHDFNNLLSVIGGYAELLTHSRSLSADDHRGLELILKSSQRAAALTRQLLAFSRHQVLQPRVLDLNAVLRDTEKMLRGLLTEDIELELRLGAEQATVLVDATQVEQILLNLAVNARDAMPEGGRLTFETAHVEADATFVRDQAPIEPRPYVKLSVSDTGVGMDEATRLRIFEPFFTTKKEGEGTGLGLAAVYGIVQQSDGFIWVRSEPGRGTTLDLCFPRLEQAPEDLADRDTTVRQARGGGETILVVEDQAAVRQLVREALEDLGYRVLIAADGMAALEVAQQHRGAIDLLLTDVVMPRMNGIQLAEKLREQSRDLRVLFTSGYADETTQQRGLLNVEALLPKPFSVALLGRRVRQALDLPPT